MHFKDRRPLFRRIWEFCDKACRLSFSTLRLCGHSFEMASRIYCEPKVRRLCCNDLVEGMLLSRLTSCRCLLLFVIVGSCCHKFLLVIVKVNRFVIGIVVNIFSMRSRENNKLYLSREEYRVFSQKSAVL